MVNDPHPFLYFLLPTVRAKGCRGELGLFNKKTKVCYHNICHWFNGEETNDISAGMISSLLNVLSFDPITHKVVNPKTHAINIIPSGEYDLVLPLDAEGTSATEVFLGKVEFPNDFFKTISYQAWLGVVENGGYAVFLESAPQISRCVK